MKAKEASRPLAMSRLSGFTFLGLALVAVGWAVLLVGLIVSDATLRGGSLVETMATRADLVTVAQTAIGSGFGLAIIGALRSGFGAFSRFFDAVLQRSAAPRATVSRDDLAPVVSVSTYERSEPPTPPQPLRSKDRNYVVLPDGSVEVETMFGTRVFATLDEAREFIR